MRLSDLITLESDIEAYNFELAIESTASNLVDSGGHGIDIKSNISAMDYAKKVAITGNLTKITQGILKLSKMIGAGSTAALGVTMIAHDVVTPGIGGFDVLGSSGIDGSISRSLAVIQGISLLAGVISSKVYNNEKEDICKNYSAINSTITKAKKTIADYKADKQKYGKIIPPTIDIALNQLNMTQKLIADVYTEDKKRRLNRRKVANKIFRFE